MSVSGADWRGALLRLADDEVDGPDGRASSSEAQRPEQSIFSLCGPPQGKTVRLDSCPGRRPPLDREWSVHKPRRRQPHAHGRPGRSGSTSLVGTAEGESPSSWEQRRPSSERRRRGKSASSPRDDHLGRTVRFLKRSLDRSPTDPTPAAPIDATDDDNDDNNGDDDDDDNDDDDDDDDDGTRVGGC